MSLHRTSGQAWTSITLLLLLAIGGYLYHANQQDPSASQLVLVQKRLLQGGMESETNRTLFDRTGRDYLGICLMTQNQHGDIREWVMYHHLHIGASKLYIYDHRSDPPLFNFLSDFIDDGIVEYAWWNKSWDNYNYSRAAEWTAQIDVYQTCLRDFGHRHQFMGFIDSDEFIAVKDGSTSVQSILKDMLQHEAICGLGIHWRIFGSSGHITRPSGGVLQSYTKCTPVRWSWNKFVKTLANTDFAIAPDIHTVKCNNSEEVVNERFKKEGHSGRFPPHQERVVIHHYMTKSKAEYMLKDARGGGHGVHRPATWFDDINSAAIEDCDDLALIGAKLLASTPELPIGRS